VYGEHVLELVGIELLQVCRDDTGQMPSNSVLFSMHVIRSLEYIVDDGTVLQPLNGTNSFSFLGVKI
jgi:hypothetical protein